MTTLTDRQQEILGFIRDFQRARRIPPTFREISDHFRVNVRAAYDHIKALERKGVIRCDTNRSRCIELLEADQEAPRIENLNVPIVGNVAAGLPITAEENLEGWLSLPESMVGSAPHFALKVRGDSMIDAGIHHGDLAIIRQQATANNGEIVVALIEEAATLKRYFLETNRVRLKAENAAYPAIYTREARIIGKLAHIIRSY